MKLSKAIALVAISIFIFPGFVLAQKEDYLRLKEKYPSKAKAFLNYDTELIFSLEDEKLKISRKIYERTILLNEKAKLYEKESISYTDDNYIHTIKAKCLSYNGKKHKSYKVNDFKDIKAISDDVFYDGANKLEFTYPNVTEGSICEVSYTQDIGNPLFMPNIYLANYVPLENMTLRVVVDKGIKIKMQKFNMDKAPDFKINESKGKITYELNLKDIEAIDDEPGGPSFQAMAPHISFNVSSYPKNGKTEKVMGSLDDMYALYTTFIDAIDQETNEAFAATVDSIIHDKKTDLEKVEAVYYWVNKNIKYIAFEEGMGGFIPRNPQDIYDRRFGDCKDMSSIQVKMLKLAGIDAHYAWTGTRSLPYKYSESCGSFIDNHMIAMYKDENTDKYYYLDATNNHLTFGYAPELLQEKEILIYKDKDEYEVYPTPITSCKDNKNAEYCTLVIEDESLRGQYKNELTGYEYLHYQNIFANFSTEQLTKRYQTYYAKGSNKSTLTNIEVDKDDQGLETSFDIHIQEYMTRTNNEIFLNLNLDKVLEDFRIPDHRKTSIDLRTTYNYTKEYVLEIPAGYAATYIPEDFSYDGDGYSVQINYVNNNDKIIYNYDLCIDKLWIHPEEFDAWSEFINNLKSNYRENVILTKN